NTPVVLKECRHGLSVNLAAWIAYKDLPSAGCRAGHETFECGECHLAAAAIERASVPNRSAPEFAAHFEVVVTAQVRNAVNELQNVVRAIVLREAGAAADAAREIGQCDIGKAAIRFRSAITERNSVVRLPISGSRTIGCFKRLIKAVVTKPERVDRG